MLIMYVNCFHTRVVQEKNSGTESQESLDFYWKNWIEF